MKKAKSPPFSTLELANELIRQQEYLLNRQSELLAAVVRRNNELVATGTKLQQENEGLKKCLDGLQRGRLRSLIETMCRALGRGPYPIKPKLEPEP